MYLEFEFELNRILSENSNRLDGAGQCTLDSFFFVSTPRNPRPLLIEGDAKCTTILINIGELVWGQGWSAKRTIVMGQDRMSNSHTTNFIYRSGN